MHSDREGPSETAESPCGEEFKLLPPHGLNKFFDIWGKRQTWRKKTMFRQASVICHAVLLQQRRSTCKPPEWLRDAAIGSPRLLHDSATLRICHSEHQSKKNHCADVHWYVQADVFVQRGCSFLLQTSEYACVFVSAVSCACVWLHRVFR